MREWLIICAGIIALLLSSCASVDRPALGDSITSSPGWGRFKQGLVDTVQQPQFWAPLATALVLQVDDQDKRLSERIREHTPLYGSAEDAAEASDDLRDLTKFSYFTTAIISPVSNNASWINTKAKLLFSEWAGVESTGVVTGWLKESSERQRPDGSNTRSFPSGHTSKATVQAKFAIINTDYLPLTHSTKSITKFSFNAMAIGTAWARIEAGKHHPSDVLAGWSLGYLASEITRVFIEDSGSSGRISAQILNNSWQLTFSQHF